MASEKPTKRVAESRLIYVCVDGMFYDDEPGECPEAGMGDHPVHRLRRRRAIVCTRCTQSYYCRVKFDEHECGDIL